MASNTAASELRQIYSIYFTPPLCGFLKHKQVLSDLLGWTNYKVGTRSTTGESTNKKESEWHVGERLKHLIKSTRASVNCNLSVDCVTEFTHCLKHALLQSCHLEGKLFFLCYHVCRMSCYSAVVEHHNISKKRPRLCLWGEMAPGQVHDIHYWLDYNERQGNVMFMYWWL